MRFEMGASLVDTARSSGSSNDCFLHDLFGEEKREHPLGTFCVFGVCFIGRGGERCFQITPLDETCEDSLEWTIASDFPPEVRGGKGYSTRPAPGADRALAVRIARIAATRAPHPPLLLASRPSFLPRPSSLVGDGTVSVSIRSHTQNKPQSQRCGFNRMRKIVCVLQGEHGERGVIRVLKRRIGAVSLMVLPHSHA